MDQNLNNERIVGFLGQSYVLIPRKVLEMLFRGEGRERSVGMVYLALFSEVFFKDGKVFLNKRYYVCKRGEFVGQCEELAKRCGMCTKTLNRSLVWLQEKDLIGLKRLNGGIRVCVCGYDSIMGIRRKEAGKEARSNPLSSPWKRPNAVWADEACSSIVVPQTGKEACNDER